MSKTRLASIGSILPAGGRARARENTVKHGHVIWWTALITALVGCGTDRPPTHHNLAVTAGDGQVAPVGTALAVEPAVLVTDDAGNPAIGSLVTFAVVSGGGTIERREVRTDGSGRASCGRWTLGLTAGAQTLSASVGSGEAVVFTATALESIIRIAIASGDAQRALPSSALGVAPAARVTDGGGRPVPGMDVTFTVSSGGGSVARAKARTDDLGMASCGTWTLGAAIGAQTLSAKVDSGPEVVFWAAALRTAPGLAVYVISPRDDQPANASVDVLVRVESTYQIREVEASLGAVTVPLVFDPGGYRGNPGGWRGTFSTADLPPGRLFVLVTVTDALGNVADDLGWAILDHYPVVTVAPSSKEALARPQLHVSATCSDDAAVGCLLMELYAQDYRGSTKLLTSIGDHLEGDVDLSAFDGGEVQLSFTGVDSANQVTGELTTVYVETSPALRLVTTDAGRILDYSGRRVLAIDESGSTPLLQIRDLDTGVITVVETSSELLDPNCYGSLVPGGAIYARRASSQSQQVSLREWRDGNNTSLGILWGGDLRVAGSYALYTLYNPLDYQRSLIVQDTSTGTSTVVATDAAGEQSDVTADGQVAFSTNDSRVCLWRAGVRTQVSPDTPGTWQDHLPKTDGTSVVFLRSSSATASPDLIVSDGMSEVTLGRALSGWVQEFAIANGWIGFELPDSQVWRYRSDRGAEQVTFFSGGSGFESIGPDGTVILSHYPRRNRAVPGAPLEDVGGGHGRVIFRDGSFFVILGRHLLEILPH